MSHTTKKETHHPSGNDGRFLWALALASALLAFLVYLPALQNGFLNWDDKEIIPGNPHIQSLSLSNLFWMLTDLTTGNWLPLTWFSYALDHGWGGSEPFAYHMDNLLLHALNTLLVFFLSLRLVNLAVRQPHFPVKRAAFLTAVLFGLHPLHVESVAWAAERKDLLCGAFYFLSLLVYLDYAARKDKKPSRYYSCLGLFLLALMSKPMAVTLPAVLLVLDAWPLRRLATDRAKVLLEKIPFFLLSISVGCLTILAQSRKGAMPSLETLGPLSRLMNALHSLIFYLGKMVAPIHLTAFYPLPAEPFSLEVLGATFLVMLISRFCFVQRKVRPALGTAWLFYLVTVSPVIGLLQAGTQAAADRYTYIPLLGFFILFSAWFAHWSSTRPFRGAVIGLALALTLSMVTLGQLEAWKNQVVLWENVVKFYPRVNDVAYSNLGNAYQAAGRLEEALKAYDAAATLAPNKALPHEGRGFVLSGLGRPEDSFLEFKKAVELEPTQPIYLLMLGNAYLIRGQAKEAVQVLEEAEKLQPQNPALLHQLALAYEKDGQKDLAAQTQAHALAMAEAVHPTSR